MVGLRARMSLAFGYFTLDFCPSVCLSMIYCHLMKKSVLVTGGEKRIGAAIAAELRARGWRVLTSSHRGDAGADIVADLSQPSGAAELYLKALGLEPELSAIVNNAALFAGDESDLRMVNLESPKKLTMMLAGREDAKCAVVNVLDAEVLCANACQNERKCGCRSMSRQR